MSAEYSEYKLLDHSGDLAFEAQGRDCLEALAHASRGLVDQIVSLVQIEEREEQKLTVSGDTDLERYIAFLNEILFLVYSRGWLPKRVRTLQTCGKLGCEELQAVVTGEPVDAARHEFKYDIKAVTYHGFEIFTRGDTAVIHFVCDL